ncbi:MAG: cupin domain-containing protein [Novosphingobium sp.]
MATIAPALRWTEVPPAVLQGEGLEPYRPGEIGILCSGAGLGGEEPRHLIAYAGQFLVDVAQVAGDAVPRRHQSADEVVLVLGGTLVLTTEETGHELRIDAGEAVLIPQGWAGLCRALPAGRWYRQVGIVPHDYFDSACDALPSGRAPQPITLHDGPGRREVHRGRYAVATEYLPGACEWTVRAVRDEIVAVIDGTLTLQAEDGRETFGPGQLVALPMGFTGAAEASAGYRALTAYWLG